MRAKAHIRRQSRLSKNPFLRLGGKAVASATKHTFYTPQIRRQAPAKNFFKRFSEGPLFSSEAPAVRPRPRQAESDVFYTAENKKQAPRRKIAQCSRGELFFPQNPARQCLSALTPALRVVLRLGQASQRAFFDPFCDVASPPPQGGREAAIPDCFLFGGKKLGKKTDFEDSRPIDQALVNQILRSYQFVERMPDFSFFPFFPPPSPFSPFSPFSPSLLLSFSPSSL